MSPLSTTFHVTVFLYFLFAPHLPRGPVDGCFSQAWLCQRAFLLEGTWSKWWLYADSKSVQQTPRFKVDLLHMRVIFVIFISIDLPVAICILVRLKHLTTQEENIGVHILNDSQICFLFKYTQRIWTMNKYWMTNLETAYLWHWNLFRFWENMF